MEEVIGQGAEATIIRTEDGVVKDRLEKPYRHPDIDRQLRTGRTKREARILEKAAAAGVPVPKVLQVEETTILLEDVPGVMLKEILDSRPELAEEIGRILAILHDKNIIHGDLTTSNMIFTPDEILIFIDFGLSYHSERVEDKAVDIHLFKQALESKHHRVLDKAYDYFLKGYNLNAVVLQRLKAVEKRGRNKRS